MSLAHSNLPHYHRTVVNESFRALIDPTRCSTPDLGPGPRAGVLSPAELDRQLESIRQLKPSSGPQFELIRALILLWHDHHETAHAIAQAIETRDGSYVHAILHRREPDYFNAKYWFRRVGEHPCFHQLAACASEILDGSEPAIPVQRIVRGDRWDALAFVDACEAAALASPPARDALRAVQQAEFETLLAYLCR